MSIYVSNLSCSVTEEKISTVFQEYGSVKRVQIYAESKADRSSSFAFVDMENDAEEMVAIQALNGSKWLGQNLLVKKARSRINGQSQCSTKTRSEHDNWGNIQNF